MRKYLTICISLHLCLAFFSSFDVSYIFADRASAVGSSSSLAFMGLIPGSGKSFFIEMGHEIFSTTADLSRTFVSF